MKRAFAIGVAAVALGAACNFGPPPAKLGEACGRVGGSSVQTDCASGGECVSPTSQLNGKCEAPCPASGSCPSGQNCRIWFRILAPDAGLGVEVCASLDGG